MQEIETLKELTPFQYEVRVSALGRLLHRLAHLMAMIGGGIFMLLVIMSVISIVGRKLFNWAVPGDMEVMQMAAAVASASYFAQCHLKSGDVKVDFFTHNLPVRKAAALDALGSLLMGFFGALLAWRTFEGAMVLKEVGETSPILNFPVWIAQAFMVPGFIALSAIGFFMCMNLLEQALGENQ